MLDLVPARRTPPLRGTERRTGLVVAVLGLLLLMAPRLTGWQIWFVHKEDGTVFLADHLEHGWSGILDPYAGFLLVGPRVVAGAAADLSGLLHAPGLYPVLVALLVSLIRVWGFWLMLTLLSAYLPDRRWALLGAAPFLASPVGGFEALGNVTNLRWFVVAGAAAALLLETRGRGQVTSAALMALLGSTSDVLCVVLLPLAALRLLTSRGSGRLPSVAFLAGLALQLLLIQPDQRGVTASDLGAGQLVLQLLTRGPVVGLYGVTLPEGVLRVVGVAGVVLACLPLVAAYVWAWRVRLPGSARDDLGLATVLAYVALAATAVNLLVGGYVPISRATWFAPGQPSRYSVVAGLVLVPALVLCLARILRARPVPRVRRLVLAVGVAPVLLAAVLDLRGDPANTQGARWSTRVSEARSACAAGTDPVTVRVTPTGIERTWTAVVPCRWIAP